MFLSLSSIAFLAGPAQADNLSLSDTSYIGATILEGDVDVTFSNVLTYDYEMGDNTYAFFEGNTLYLGNSDGYNNSIDAIVEFYWFQSSIDRGTDFYVAVIKARSTPGDDCYWGPWLSGADCSLWADDWQDWGEHPVLSVEALTDVNREQGAFRWDWAVPFENYGMDAYGQITFSNQYGIGANAEGAVMAHEEITLDEDGNVKAAGNVQVKGYLSTEYSVKTQYQVTLYEWDMFVDGRADQMAWDMYLNLGARDSQSAYHEYFMSIQVEEGQTFMLDEMNIGANFDIGWYDPFAQELGLSLQNIQISAPFYEPEWDDEDEWNNEDETDDEDWNDWDDEEEEEVIDDPETEVDDGNDGDDGFNDEEGDMPTLNPSEQPIKGGCSALTGTAMGGLSAALMLLGLRRRED